MHNYAVGSQDVSGNYFNPWSVGMEARTIGNLTGRWCRGKALEKRWRKKDQES